MGSHYARGAEPSTDQIRRTLAEVVDALRSARVDFLLMGGLSAATLARRRPTDDIDVFVRPDGAGPAIDALAGAGFDTEETDPQWIYKAVKHGVLVDVIFRSTGGLELDHEMLRRGSEREHMGVFAPLVSPEDLVVIKAVAAAEHSPSHWYDALAVVARCELDWEYLVRRGRQAGPHRLLSLLLYAEADGVSVPGRVIDDLLAAAHREPQQGVR